MGTDVGHTCAANLVFAADVSYTWKKPYSVTVLDTVGQQGFVSLCQKGKNIYLKQWLANVNVRRSLFLSRNKEVNVCDGQVRARRLIQLGNRLRIVQYLQFSADSGPIN